MPNLQNKSPSGHFSNVAYFAQGETWEISAKQILFQQMQKHIKLTSRSYRAPY